MAIRQERTFAATPAHVFEALMTSEGHTAFTGAPAEVRAEDGTAWSAYGGAIHGRNILIEADRRIVQAWRPGNWPEGKYSLVHIELTPVDEGTRLSLEHTGYPEDEAVHLEAGWDERYWVPLAAFLAR